MKYSTLKLQPGISVLSLANFLSALGGGCVLRHSMGVLKQEPWLQGGSLMAFLIGISIGLVILLRFPRKQLMGYLHWFTLATALLALAMSFMLGGPFAPQGLLLHWEAWLFFGLLCTHFSTWFLARILRADFASGHNQQISWVEFAYLFGIIFGIVLWKDGSSNVAIVLLVNVALQLATVGLDLFYANSGYGKGEMSAAPQSISHQLAWSAPFSRRWFSLMVAFFFFVTVGHQIINFGFANLLAHSQFDVLASYVLGAGYLGSALAALLTGFLRFSFGVDHHSKTFWKIGFELRNREYQFSTPWMIAFSLSLMALAIFIWSSTHLAHWVIPILVVISGITYEILGLCCLDLIGARSKAHGKNGMVALAFGLTGFPACLVLFILAQSAHPVGLSLFLLPLCFLGAAASQMKAFRRDAIYHSRKCTPRYM